jgi:hypothetical protein
MNLQWEVRVLITFIVLLIRIEGGMERSYLLVEVRGEVLLLWQLV